MPTERQREVAMKVLVSLYCFDLDMDKARYERNAQDIGSFQEMDLRTIVTAISEAEKRGMVMASELLTVQDAIDYNKELGVILDHSQKIGLKHFIAFQKELILTESEKETT